ncbi:MAG: Tol-Pal system protein TolB [Rhodospirillales bacterium]|nr:Tol-Pal system protein TolB [Rhodospirillales bacterium]
MSSTGHGVSRLSSRLSLRPSLLVVVFVIVAAMAIVAQGARAELKIDITRGIVEPTPIAIFPFSGEQQKEQSIGRKISDVIAADLVRSGLFRSIDQAAFVQEKLDSNSTPRFGDWRVVGAEALVHGSTTLEDSRLKVEFRLWDVAAEQQLVGRVYQTAPSNWRRIAHIVADAIYKRITGEDGYFDTRIVYVAESGLQTQRVKRLAIMDQDGENHRFLTDGRELVLTPRFSPSLQEITYMSYRDGAPRVYIKNIDTGREEMVGSFPGMTFSPRFSADGTLLIMSMSEDGNSEIYTVDVRTREKMQLTKSSAIDTSPSFSPDGKQIVFNSDRGGSQQLYVMDADGANVRRLSHGSGRYATPVWSPRGDLIAFTKIHRGNFYIGVMRPDGTGERLLTKGFHVEGPTWAPNGRVLMYFQKDRTDEAGGGGRSLLYSVDLTGQNKKLVATPMDASDPAWSPLIP